MAELATITRTSAAIALGQKVNPTNQNRVRVGIFEMPAAYAAPANGDTFATGIVLPKGTRLLAPVTVSGATNAASVTLSVGLRDATTKVAVDATALVNALAVTTAATVRVNTGTKLTGGSSTRCRRTARSTAPGRRHAECERANARRVRIRRPLIEAVAIASGLLRGGDLTGAACPRFY